MEISACRLCLAKEDLAPLFGKLSPCHYTRNQVYLTTGVVILPSDCLPQVACIVCIERIKDAIDLRKTSTETQNKLQLILPKTNITYDNDASDILYEIDNFKTEDEEMDKYLEKINKKVIKTIHSLTDYSHIDNKISNNDLNKGSDFDNESENNQPDNHNYQADFDHNYYRRSNNLPVIKVTCQRLTKNAEKDLKRNNTKKIIRKETRNVLNLTKKGDHSIKKLMSRINQQNTYAYLKSNIAMLPARQFKRLFQPPKTIETKTSQNSSKNLEKRQKQWKENTINEKHILKKISQIDNEISQPDNKSSHSDNSNNHDDNEDDFNRYLETEDWDENQFKEMEVQKRIDKKRQEKFMSLAVSRYPINGRLKCKVCLQTLTRHAFVSHAKRHFPPEFACETCGKMFYGNSDLQYHRQRMHEQVKPLACTMCDYRGVWKQDMTGHMRIHTGERPFVCDVCNSAFRVRADIVQHLRTHFGVKTIQCPRCPHKWFRCLSDVAKHNRRIHHNFTYFCHLCPKTYHGYGGRVSVRKHLSRIHGIPRSEQPLKLKYAKIPIPDEIQGGIIA